MIRSFITNKNTKISLKMENIFCFINLVLLSFNVFLPDPFVKKN